VSKSSHHNLTRRNLLGFALTVGAAEAAASRPSAPSFQPQTRRSTLSVVDFGADPSGETNAVDAFNRAIRQAHMAGGGEVTAVGIFHIAGPTSIYLLSNIRLNLRGATLTGDGDNILIKSGTLIDNLMRDISNQYGSDVTGSGSQHVSNSSVIGGTFAHASCAILAHRFNYGCTIEHNLFTSTLKHAYISQHSWGLKVHQNTIYAPVIMRDFVDWTEVSGNSFEGPNSSSNGIAALTITTGGFGGAYSTNIVSNGFHHWAIGISLTCETTNLSILHNHFEDVQCHIAASTFNNYHMDISQNWMRANLATGGLVVGMRLLNVKNSKLSPNYYSESSPCRFEAHIIAQTHDCWGNVIELDYAPDSKVDLSLYRLNDANQVIQRGGSNNAALVQPTEERMSGSGKYTIERYKRRYHAVPNQIPYCEVSYEQGVVQVDTWIDSDSYGTRKLLAFNFSIEGKQHAYLVGGHLLGLNISVVENIALRGGGPGLELSASSCRGKLRLTLRGTSPQSKISGWVKEV
jgi:hypothetical protein